MNEPDRKLWSNSRGKPEGEKWHRMISAPAVIHDSLLSNTTEGYCTYCAISGRPGNGLSFWRYIIMTMDLPNIWGKITSFAQNKRNRAFIDLYHNHHKSWSLDVYDNSRRSEALYLLQKSHDMGLPVDTFYHKYRQNTCHDNFSRWQTTKTSTLTHFQYFSTSITSSNMNSR